MAVRDDSLVRNREATFMEVRAWLARHVAAACVLGVASIASAQITTGTITGTVRDGQGGVIPGATVILTSDTQGTKSSPVVTSGDRRFRVREPQGRHLHHRSRDAVVQDAEAVWRAGQPRRARRRPALSCSRSAARRKSSTSRPKSPLVQASSAERSFTIATDSVTNLPIAGRAFTAAGRAGAGRHRHQPHRRSLLDRRRRHQHPDGRRVDDGHGQQPRDHRSRTSSRSPK